MINCRYIWWLFKRKINLRIKKKERNEWTEKENQKSHISVNVCLYFSVLIYLQWYLPSFPSHHFCSSMYVKLSIRLTGTAFTKLHREKPSFLFQSKWDHFLFFFFCKRSSDGRDNDGGLKKQLSCLLVIGLFFRTGIKSVLTFHCRVFVI